MTTSNVDELISQLQEAANSNLIDVNILSTAGVAKFKQMTVKQQSSLISGIISQETDKNAFSYNRTTSQIIMDNNTQSAHIKTIDKGSILVQMRRDTMGDVVKIGEDTYDISEMDFKLDDESVEKINSIHTASISGISISYTTPSLSRDMDMNQVAEDRWKEIEAADIISDLFKLELSKYITSITINEDNIIDISTLDVDSQLKICDNLPVKLTRQVMTYIQDVRFIEQDMLQVDENKYIPTDITLFDT